MSALIYDVKVTSMLTECYPNVQAANIDASAFLEKI